MLSRLLCVAAGGALGAMSRFLIVFAMGRHLVGFPWGTLTVNVVGSFLAGVAMRAFFHGSSGYEIHWLFWVVGFLGGFTTFSAFSIDIFLMLQKQQYLLFAGNILIHVVGCLCAVILGYHLAKMIFT